MHFGLDEEQQELASVVKTLLDRRADSAAVRVAMTSELGYDESLWHVLNNEIGASSLAIPEEFGGEGLGSFATHIVLEQLGYSLAPSPLLGSAVLAAQAILLAGNEDACARLLPAIAEGTIAALAWAGETGEWSTAHSDIQAVDGEPWRLSGRANLVMDGAHAEILVVIAQTPDGLGIFEILDPDAVERLATPALDPTLRFVSLVFRDVAARPLAVDASPMLATLRDRALVAVTALQVGAAQRGLDMTVQYSKDRVQFGRAIGSFQALKHRMADMLVEVETARTLSWAAAWASEKDAPDLDAQAALAKAWCSDALDRVASETIQLHGGIAITWEHDAQLVFKRAHALGQLLGQASGHRRRLYELRGLAAR
jgi:alkylation response protein AidB-like acyl-CoA dehydrogenase